MTSIKEALKDLAQIEKKQAALVQERDAVQTADQKIAAAAAELEAQQDLVAELERQEAQKQLSAHRKKQCGLVAELAAFAGELDRLQATAEKLAGEVDDLSRPARKTDPMFGKVDSDIMRDIAALCYREAVDIRYFEKSFKIRAKNLNYGC